MVLHEIEKKWDQEEGAHAPSPLDPPMMWEAGDGNNSGNFFEKLTLAITRTSHQRYLSRLDIWNSACCLHSYLQHTCQLDALN